MPDQLPTFTACKNCGSKLSECRCPTRSKRPAAAIFLDELPEPAQEAIRDAVGLELNVIED